MIDAEQIRRRIGTVRSFAPWPELRDDTLALCDEVDRLRDEVEALKLQRNHVQAQLFGARLPQAQRPT